MLVGAQRHGARGGSIAQLIEGQMCRSSPRLSPLSPGPRFFGAGDLPVQKSRGERLKGGAPTGYMSFIRMFGCFGLPP